MRQGPPRARALVGLLAGLLVVSALAAPASAAVPRPDRGDAWFGPNLPGEDRLVRYADRLGAAPSLVSVEVAYPLDEHARTLVETFATDAARSGTVVVLDARPTTALTALTADDADQFARTVATLEEREGTRFLVRFAPEMNGSWETWGQQPAAYVDAFRDVADALHRDTGAGTVWAPVYGSGYPFRAVDGADGALGEILARDRSVLDTSGDGRLDAADDPYRPFYPGDAAVDWVGLSLYQLGQSQALRRNTDLPEAELRLRLDELWGYGDDRAREPFVDRFASLRQPLLVETAAPYNPAVGGDPEISVKRQWWRQLLAAVDDDPRIAGASWLEVSRVEPEVADVEVDWRVTASPPIARSLLRDLRATRIVLAPVYDAQGERDGDRSAPRPDGRAPGSDPTLGRDAGPGGWWWLGAAALLLGSLLLTRLLPRWRYAAATAGPPQDVRDERLDLVRGAVLVGAAAVLVVAVLRASTLVPPWTVVAAVGTLLVVSGAAHQLTERRTAALGGGPAATSAHLKRAVVVYLVAVLVTVLHLLLDAAPGVDSPFGSYARAGELLGYPPPGDVATDLLALRVSPGSVALLGMFAMLAVVAAPVAAVVRRGGWWLALLLSWAVFGIGLTTGATISALGWEAGWPVLVWQLPFVHGLVVAELLRGSSPLSERLAALGVAAVGLGAAGWGTWLLTGSSAVAQPAVVVALVAPLALLVLVTAAWTPVRAGLGWLRPLGRRPLLLSVLLVLAVVGASLG